MMIATLLLLIATQTGSGPGSGLGSASGPIPTAPPVDWAAMPALRYISRPELPAGLDEFVRGEVIAGRCAIPRGARSLRVELAVLVEAGMEVRMVPRAMACATVEQFAAGLMSHIVRDHLDPASPAGWYRATLDVAWRS